MLIFRYIQKRAQNEDNGNNKTTPKQDHGRDL